MYRTARGFTLVELMVVCAIAGILLAIVVPSYNSQIRKSRRTEAKTAALDLAAREERFYSTRNAYTATATNLGYAALPTNVGAGYYTISVAVPRAGAPAGTSSFLVTLVPVVGKGQEKDTTCATYTVDELGQQIAKNSVSAVTTATCWQ